MRVLFRSRPASSPRHRSRHRARPVPRLARRPAQPVSRRGARGAPMTLRLRDDLVDTARRMSQLGLAPGTTGNVSVRTERGFLVTPSGMSYDQLRGDDAVAIDADGTLRPGQRTPSTEWRLHRDVLAARPDARAIVHTHSLFCTTVACLRRPIPAIHYMIVRAGGDEIPCADY